MKQWVIFDLDGTLCDTDHRIHHAKAKRWDAFHAGLLQDRPRRAESILLWALRGNANVDGIALITGRPERYRQQTVQWLGQNDLLQGVDMLLMRPDADFRPATTFKREMYQKYFVAENREVLFVVEDRDKVVDMWRSLGLTCFHCAPGGY